MKTLWTIAIFGAACIGFTACTMQPEGLSVKPVIKQGVSTSLKEAQYVRLIPAGTNIPFHVNVTGNAFAQSLEKVFFVVLKHDTYVYGNTERNNNVWVSHDKKNWYSIDEAFDGEMYFAIESTPENSSIHFSLEANRKIKE